jgi:hypothetical protein
VLRRSLEIRKPDDMRPRTNMRRMNQDFELPFLNKTAATVVNLHLATSVTSESRCASALLIERFRSDQHGLSRRMLQ